VAKPIKKQEKLAELVVAQNRAASYNYHLLEKLEAGMVLLGTEVKSLREGKANIRDAYAVIRAGAVWLLNCHIGEYLPGGPFNHSPLRARKLLLRKEQIEKLEKPQGTKSKEHDGSEPDDEDSDKADGAAAATSVSQRLEQLERLVLEMSDRLKSIESRLPAPQKK